jgi:hypothetical protein
MGIAELEPREATTALRATNATIGDRVLRGKAVVNEDDDQEDWSCGGEAEALLRSWWPGQG